MLRGSTGNVGAPSLPFLHAWAVLLSCIVGAALGAAVAADDNKETPAELSLERSSLAGIVGPPRFSASSLLRALTIASEFVVECNKPARAAAAKCSLLLLFMVLSMSMVEKLFNYKKLWWYSVFLLSCCLVPFIVQDF